MILGSVTAFAMNKDESLLMLGCENGTIVGTTIHDCTCHDTMIMYI